MRTRVLTSLALLAGALLIADAPARGDDCVPGQSAGDGGGICGSAAGQQSADDQRRLVTQKLSLLQAYLNSASIRRARDDGGIEATALVAEAETYLATARKSLDDGLLQDAGEALDKGLRSASMASAQMARPQRSTEQEKRRYDKLDHQIRSYLDAIDEALKEADPTKRPDDSLARVDKLVAEAAKLADTGQYNNANKLLTEAYQLTVTMVTTLRTGATLVSTLNFATAADELEYERRRNGSYEMLVAILLEERRGDTSPLKRLADKYLAESHELRDRAESEAAAGDYRTAILSMEEATGRLVRILQAGGLPVPE